MLGGHEEKVGSGRREGNKREQRNSRIWELKIS